MFNRFSVIFITLVILFSASFVYESYAQKPVVGQIVSLNDVVKGGTGKMTLDEAKKLADNGSPIVFKSGKKIYFIFNEDGSFGGKRLAKYADKASVSIVGKSVKKSGLDVIIMSSIE